jgi:hypothetical protein
LTAELSNDRMEGRNTGSPAYMRAAPLVASKFEDSFSSAIVYRLTANLLFTKGLTTPSRCAVQLKRQFEP